MILVPATLLQYNKYIFFVEQRRCWVTLLYELVMFAT